MEVQLEQGIMNTIENYHLPRYSEIPNVGLYLNQVAKFINDCLEPLGDPAITESMISNYVKKHLISNPVKKQYDREQIAYLLFISLGKSVLSMEHIQILFELQKKTCSSLTAYNYFCSEFENALQYLFGRKDSLEKIGTEEHEAKHLCRNVIITMVRKLYLDQCFQSLSIKKEEEK